MLSVASLQIPLPNDRPRPVETSEQGVEPTSQRGYPTVPTTMRAAKASGPMQLTQVKHPSQNPILVERWWQLLKLLGAASTLFSQLQDSAQAMSHASRLLDSFAPTTAFRYISAVIKFLQTCQAMGVSFVHIMQLADILLIISKSRSTDHGALSGSFAIKALRWIHRLAGVECLRVTFDPLVNSFLILKHGKDRKEAPPLPLWVLMQWERRILQSQTPPGEILLLGAFLWIIWSGLRFADAQRILLKSLVWDKREVRGMCRRSKTMARGHPFGLKCSGFLSHGDFSWVYKFLITLDSVLYKWQPVSFDFILPLLDSEGMIQEYEPISYTTAMFHFRRLLVCPWRSGPSPMEDQPLNFTLRSMKATLLSWGPQLGNLVTDNQRLQQGHHSDGKPLMHLYGRDSVWSQLEYQSIIITQVQSGFRPKVAQHRGGQFPLRDRCFWNGSKKALPGLDFLWFQFGPDAPLPLGVEEPLDLATNEESASSSSSGIPRQMRKEKHR